MKNTHHSTSEGALIIILGMIFGALLTLVFLEYGTRQQQKGAEMMTPKPPPEPQPEPPLKGIWNGHSFVTEQVS